MKYVVFFKTLALFSNLFIATVLGDELTGFISRKKRMSEPHRFGDGAIYVAKSDGRYLRKIIGGRLQIPTAIVVAPQIGRICYADAGSEAKIECADMDGKHREVISSHIFLRFIQ